MLKFLSLTFFLVNALVLLTPKVAFSSPKPVGSRSSVVSTGINTPVCYMRTANGTTLNLTSLCGNSSGSVASTRQPVGYNTTVPSGSRLLNSTVTNTTTVSTTRATTGGTTTTNVTPNGVTTTPTTTAPGVTTTPNTTTTGVTTIP